MRSGVLGIVVAHSLVILLASAAALAEPTKSARDSAAPAAKEAEKKGEEVNASDLALGQPAPSEPAQAPASPQATATASPPTVAPQAQAAPVQTVASPTLASTAVIANGVQTTAVVDIRLLPKQLPYRGEQTMDGYVLDERRRWWMIITGGALFGLGYIAALAGGSEHDFDHGFGFMAIPVAGPWVTMATHDEVCADDGEVCFEDNSEDAQLAAVGILQVAGAVLLPIGLMSTKQVWLRKDLAVGFMPTRVGRNGYGAVLQGTF